MDLKIKDIADMLNVSETTIRRWISESKIPHYRINQHYRFSRNEIEHWVLSHKRGDAPSAALALSAENRSGPGQEKKSKGSRGSRQFSLFRAIHKGMVLHNTQGNTKEEVIQSTMKTAAVNLNLDAEVITDLLLDREKLMPTALNNGIGIPHTRDFLLKSHYDAIIVSFPEKPIPYGALDGKPVHTLFFLLACEDKRHLHLLAKIAHLCNDLKALEFFQSKPLKSEFLDYIKNWESALESSEEDC